MLNNTVANDITARNVLAAVEAGAGDYRNTVRATARFCTEELRAVAGEVEVRAKFAEKLPAYRPATRQEALERLCGWYHDQKIQAWGRAYQASRQSAIAELPEALEQLGAAL